MQVWEAIQSKHAIRKFKDEPLPDDIVRRILDAGRLAQSAKNSQPWDFIAVQERDRLRQIANLSDNLWHVGGAALCVCILTPAPGERFPWHMFDIGQAAAYMQLAAHDQGVASCPGSVYHPDEARDLLGYPADKLLTILLSFGYPADRERKGLGQVGRRDFADVVHWETWYPEKQTTTRAGWPFVRVRETTS